MAVFLHLTKWTVKDIQEAVEIGMKLNLAEIDAIANSTEAATFENTIAAMERSGAELDRVFSYYGIMSSNMSSPEFREIQAELAPKLSEFSSNISQNKALFDRIKTVYEASLVTPFRCRPTTCCRTNLQPFCHAWCRIES